MRGALGRVVTVHGSTQLDAALAGALLAVDGAGAVADLVHGDVGAGGAAALVGVGAACAVMFFRWRRSRPLLLAAGVTVGIIAAAALAHRALLTQRTGVQIALVAYALGSWAVRRRAALAVIGVSAVLLALGTADEDGRGINVATVPAALAMAPWFAGAAARLRRQHLAGVEERLARAETERGTQARQAVAQERARIARELHDVVAHHVSLIGVQAGAARTVLGRDDGETRRALAGIESSSRDAVREMRRLVDVLDTGDGAALAAPPRRAELEAMCDGFGAAGLAVARSIDPAVDTLAPAHALTVYRIVEEALTIVTRHSQATGGLVAVALDEREVRLVVTDPGPSQRRAPVPPPGAGRGLTGMRERVALFGGRLATGPDGEGFRVEAVLPRQAP